MIAETAEAGPEWTLIVAIVGSAITVTAGLISVAYQAGGLRTQVENLGALLATLVSRVRHLERHAVMDADCDRLRSYLREDSEDT